MQRLLLCIFIALFSASMATANTPNDLPADVSQVVAEDLAVAEALKTVEENQKAVKAEVKKESEIPLKLNEGKKASEQSSGLISNNEKASSISEIIWLWLRRTPFGVPVVPDV